MQQPIRGNHIRQYLLGFSQVEDAFTDRFDRGKIHTKISIVLYKYKIILYLEELTVDSASNGIQHCRITPLQLPMYSFCYLIDCQAAQDNGRNQSNNEQ